MTDIVERLRAPAYWISGSDEGHEGDNSAPMEAARTIEILRVELAKVNMENDRLTRTNRAKREHRDKLLAAKAKDAARIERLEAALLPFAEESKRFDDACEHFNHPRMPDKHQPRTHFTHGQLRAARAAIENKNVW